MRNGARNMPSDMKVITDWCIAEPLAERSGELAHFHASSRAFQ